MLESMDQNPSNFFACQHHHNICKDFFHWRSLIFACEQIEELERFKCEAILQAKMQGSCFRSCLCFMLFMPKWEKLLPHPLQAPETCLIVLSEAV